MDIGYPTTVTLRHIRTLSLSQMEKGRVDSVGLVCSIEEHVAAPNTVSLSEIQYAIYLALHHDRVNIGPALLAKLQNNSEISKEQLTRLREGYSVVARCAAKRGYPGMEAVQSALDSLSCQM